jgi:adenine-specific DNA methylase
MRDVREQKRDLERELRDLEREKRDIDFQSKVGKLDADQQKELTRINSKSAELKKQLDAITQKYQVMEQDYQKKRTEQAKIAAEKQKELIATISVNFANTLCDYGASLRELKDNEFVSLQLSNSHGRNSQDIYWVFKKSDINQCVTGKLTTESLLKKADYYQY